MPRGAGAARAYSSRSASVAGAADIFEHDLGGTPGFVSHAPPVAGLDLAHEHRLLDLA